MAGHDRRNNDFAELLLLIQGFQIARLIKVAADLVWSAINS